jgi:NAD(P)-dependent dehydrogenase (short-subunit alcohol dehydrogenase family)
VSTAHRDRRFVVSGGASGIGLATARLALQRGGRACLLDCDRGRLADAARELGANAFPALCDVADAGAVASAIEEAAERLGGIDAVVSSAGADLRVALESMDEADWARTLALNLTGPMLLCRAALPHLRRAGGGTIVNVSSAAGLSPLMHRTAYCAAKAGLVMFGKALAMEVAAEGIRVNAVCPGAVDTPMFRSSYETSEDPERDLEAIRQRYAMHRIAAPEEVAEAILYLSGAGSSYITGTALAVDGGRTFH